MNNIDRRFLTWGVIWLVWFAVFVGMTLQGWGIIATATATASFCWLWPKFCDMMVRR